MIRNLDLSEIGQLALGRCIITLIQNDDSQSSVLIEKADIRRDSKEDPAQVVCFVVTLAADGTVFLNGEELTIPESTTEHAEAIVAVIQFSSEFVHEIVDGQEIGKPELHSGDK